MSKCKNIKLNLWQVHCRYLVNAWLINWLIDYIVFYAVSAIFRPCNGLIGVVIITRSMTSLLNIIFVCLFGVICSHSRFFSTHMDTSPLPVKDCKFGHGHWAKWFLSVPHSGHLRAPVTHLLPSVWQCGTVNTCFNEFCNQDSYSQPSTFEQNALTDCTSTAASLH